MLEQKEPYSEADTQFRSKSTNVGGKLNKKADYIYLSLE